MVKFHGNYCGPNWSDGKSQTSVVGSATAIDAFDETCKQHDAAYARGENLRQADLRFAKQNILNGIKPTIAGILVGAQGLLRSRDKPKDPSNNQTTKSISRTENPLSIDMQSRRMRPLPIPLPIPVPPKASRKQPNPPSARTSGLKSALAPVAFSRRVAMQKPAFSSINGETCIRHREYIGTIANSTSFVCTPYAINPGLSDVFPWLTNIAANYDKYRFRKLRFDYVPAVSTSTGGRITLAFNYNAGDNAPVSKQQVFSVSPNAEQAVWAELILQVPVIPETLYTREYLVPGSDIKTFDMGQLLVATDLGANTSTIGELYVEYEVVLTKPHPQFVSTTEVYNLTTTTAANLWPSTGGTVYLPNGMVSSSTVANSFTFSLSGRYLIVWQVTGTVVTDQAVDATIGTITQVGGGSTDFPNAGTTKSMSVGVYDVVVDSTTKIANIRTLVAATTVTKAMFFASLLDANTPYNTNT